MVNWIPRARKRGKRARDRGDSRRAKAKGTCFPGFGVEFSFVGQCMPAFFRRGHDECAVVSERCEILEVCSG